MKLTIHCNFGSDRRHDSQQRGTCCLQDRKLQNKIYLIKSILNTNIQINLN
jgi:hypothetical protein